MHRFCSTISQYLHSELIEYIFNTPSHHRVHHGSNPEYIDKNLAGVLIIWDRMFGTFQQELFRPTYGLTKNINTYNPIRIAFHEWTDIWQDIRQSTSIKQALKHTFGRPGWKPSSTHSSDPKNISKFNSENKNPSIS